MNKLKVGDRVAVYATVVDVADFEKTQRVNIEFREGKATRWFPDKDLRRLIKRRKPSADRVMVAAAILGGLVSAYAKDGYKEGIEICESLRLADKLIAEAAE